jgi:hypothetical protein
MPTDNTGTLTNEDPLIAAASPADVTKPAIADTKVKGDDGQQDDGKTFSADYVKDLRKESANYRNQAKELQRKAEEAETKATELSDVLKVTKEEAQKALSETKRLNSAFEQRVINAELKAAAMEAGLIDMDAFKMADTSKVKITDSGDVIGIKELIGDLKKEKAYLFKDITTSNKNSSAPPTTSEANEKPTYANQKEFDEAKRNFLASLA